jgi:predicted dehydrogenase
VIEVRDLIEGIMPEDSSPLPDFREAYEVQRVIDAIIDSSRRGTWSAID